jgi:hypothetical protein
MRQKRWLSFDLSGPRQGFRRAERFNHSKGSSQLMTSRKEAGEDNIMLQCLAEPATRTLDHQLLLRAGLGLTVRLKNCMLVNRQDPEPSQTRHQIADSCTIQQQSAAQTAHAMCS